MVELQNDINIYKIDLPICILIRFAAFGKGVPVIFQYKVWFKQCDIIVSSLTAKMYKLYLSLLISH